MSIEIHVALLLKQMIHLHGAGADDWKGTPEWCAAAETVEEEAIEVLEQFRKKYFDPDAYNAELQARRDNGEWIPRGRFL